MNLLDYSIAADCSNVIDGGVGAHQTRGGDKCRLLVLDMDYKGEEGGGGGERRCVSFDYY